MALRDVVVLNEPDEQIEVAQASDEYNFPVQINVSTVKFPDGSVALSATGLGTYAASNITVTPAGNISSTDTQAAIEELDGKIHEIKVSDYGTTDIAINSAFTAAKALSVAIGADGRARSAPTVDFGNAQYLCAAECVWPSGVIIKSDGAELKATANGMTVLTTEGPVVTAATYGEYGSRSQSVIGILNINGDGKASHGFIGDTAAGCDFTGIDPTGCTYQNFTGVTGTATAGNATISSTSATTDVSVDDTCRVTIGGTVENHIFTVVSKTANSVTFDTAPEASGAATIDAVGCGSLYKMVQQGDIALNAHSNGVGAVFTQNVDGYDCTDLHIASFLAKSNEHGCALNALSGSLLSSVTFQQSTYGPDLSIGAGCSGNTYGRVYIESINDANAEAIAVGRSTYLQGIPLVHNAGEGQTFITFRYPHDPATVGWRRLMHTRGTDTVVKRIVSNSAAVNVNPSRAGDYAPIEQLSTAGTIYLLEGWTGQTTVTVPDQLIIDEAGVYMPSPRSFSLQMENGQQRQYGTQSLYGKTNAINLINGYVTGDTQPRVTMYPGYFLFGSGSAAQDVILDRVAANILGVGAGDSFRIRDVTNGGGASANITNSLQIQAASGVTYHLWVDSAGKLRINNALGVAEDTGGTVVGTQT